MYKRNAARPKIKIRLTRGDQVMEVTSWILVLGIWILAIRAYPSLHETIPTHFNAAGKVDGYGGKATIWILPVLGTLIFTGLTILHRFPHLYNYPTPVTHENAFRQYTLGTRLIRTVKGIVVLIFGIITYMIIQNAEGQSIEGWRWVLPFTIGITFIPLVIYVVMSFKNQ